MLHAIDNFAFLALHGNPVPPKEHPITREREGVDGTGVWLTGDRGDRFTLRSQVDSPNVATAQTTFFYYTQLIGSNPVILVQNDYNYASEGWGVVVLDVRQTDMRAIGASSGGLYANSRAWLEAEWDLMAVPHATT